MGVMDRLASRRLVRVMDDDTRNLTRQISAFMTKLIEQAHELSVQGQSPRISADNAAILAAALRAAAADVGALARAIEVVVGSQD